MKWLEDKGLLYFAFVCFALAFTLKCLQRIEHVSATHTPPVVKGTPDDFSTIGATERPEYISHSPEK